MRAKASGLMYTADGGEQDTKDLMVLPSARDFALRQNSKVFDTGAAVLDNDNISHNFATAKL